MALLCQIGYYIGMRSLDMCIFVTFSMSIAVCFAADYARNKRSIFAYLLLCASICAAFFFTEILPAFLADYSVDYGFWGVMLPVFIFLGRTKKEKLICAAIVFCFLSAGLEGVMGNIQWFSLAAIPLLALYNGARGRYPMKWLFYFYYPVHLLILYGIGCLIYL